MQPGAKDLVAHSQRGRKVWGRLGLKVWGYGKNLNELRFHYTSPLGAECSKSLTVREPWASA